MGEDRLVRSLNPKPEPVPFHLERLEVRLLKFSLICVACALAAGPVSSWPTVVPLLAEYHVFGNTTFRNVTKVEQQAVYDLIFNLSSAFALIGNMVAGVTFDNLVREPFPHLERFQHLLTPRFPCTMPTLQGPNACAMAGALISAAGLAWVF